MTGPASTTGPTRRRSFASSGLTYEQIARELGLLLCAGCDPQLVAGNHTNGWTERHPGWDPAGVVHWTPRRMTRRGLYQFLRLASQLLYPAEAERWLALYRQDQNARRLARRFRVRIPADYGKREKARVRLDLAKLAPTDTEFPEQRQLIRRARAWARQ